MGAPLYLSFPRRWRQGEMDRLECYWCRAFQPKSVHPSLSEPQPPTPTFTYLPRDDRCWMNWSENACMAFLYGKDTEYWYTTSAIDCFADARRINESRKWRGCLPVSAAKGRNEIFIILFFFFVLLYAGHQTASNGSFQSQGIFFLFYGLRWNWNQRTSWIVRYDGDDLLAWRVFAEQCNRSGSFKPFVFQACTS